jgi:hypothetical protein
MEGSSDISDTEFLYKMRMEYLQAVQVEDYARISGVIVPQFWNRFSKHYEEYARSWKSLAFSRQPIQVIIDPGTEREKELDWAEHVLKGQIDLIL